MAVKATEQKDKVRLFTSHGLNFSDKGGSQVVGECPFCGSEKFYVSKAKGQYHCKVCGEKGNGYTFLNRLHEHCMESTSREQYEELGKARALSPVILKREELAFDKATERWLIPVTNGSTAISNLLTYDSSLTKGATRSTATCARHLYRSNKLESEGPIYICEGEWDALALLTLMDKADIYGINVVAVPGAETFKKEWVEYFENRDVVLLYDNDSSGQDGKKRVVELISDKVKSLQSLHWPSSFPEKYDLRDFVSEKIKTAKTCWKLLQKMIVEEKSQSKPKIKRTSFNSVMKDFRSVLHMTESMDNSLLITMASIISTRMKGDPLWLYIVGPAGCGKSTLLQSFQNSQNCVFRSKLTATSFVSGMKMEDGSDPSLLSQLHEQSLLIKDFTAIKSMPIVVQEHLYGILRDAYDGNVLVEYGNGVKRHYPEVHFSVIAGITDIVHGDSRAALGERFLKVEMIPTHEEYDQEAQIRASISNIINQVEAEKHLEDSVDAFVYHLNERFGNEKMPVVPAWVIDRTVSLCQIVGLLRSTVLRERSDDLSYRPRPEIGTRIANQLIKLGTACAFVMGKKKIDHQIYKIMEGVAFSTAYGWHTDIVKYMITKPRGTTVEDISVELQISLSSVQRRLSDLRDLKIVYAKRLRGQHGRGRPSNIWAVNDSMRSHWQKAKVGKRS